jgi:hypothetical protein
MPESLYAYRNLKTGETYAFGVERPDLVARPNWEQVAEDDLDVPDVVKENLEAQGAAAKAITEAGKTRESQQAISGRDTDDDSAGGLGGALIDTATAGAFTAPGAPGGVLSRNVVTGTPQAEIQARAAANTDAIAFHGVLAEQVDGSRSHVEVPEIAAGITVENAEPIGDAKKSPVAGRTAAVRKAARSGQRGEPGGKTEPGKIEPGKPGTGRTDPDKS